MRSRSKYLVPVAGVAILGLWLLAPRFAFATPNFPPAIQQDLSLAAPPDCSICHTDGDQGGKGTATTPFAVNMRARGLVEFDTTSLSTALNQMETSHVDSTGDCLDDIDELKAGRNPNLPDPAGACADAGAEAGTLSETPAGPAPPTYGCVGSISPSRTPDSPYFYGVSLIAGLSLLRRRRRAPR
ncbi:MAG: hypothetical protein ABI183_21525 [Polyangiaceae bacterium]